MFNLSEFHFSEVTFFQNWYFNISMFFVLFFHFVGKISNSNMWTTKHLAQASCTKLTLLKVQVRVVRPCIIIKALLTNALFLQRDNCNYYHLSWFLYCFILKRMVIEQFLKFEAKFKNKLWKVKLANISRSFTSSNFLILVVFW